MVDVVITIHGRIAVHVRGMARACDGTAATLPVIGRRCDAGATGGADKLSRRRPRRACIHRHFIGGDNFVALLRPVDSKTCPVCRFAGETMGAAGIFSPGKITSQPDHRAGLDPVGGKFDLCHGVMPPSASAATGADRLP